MELSHSSILVATEKQNQTSLGLCMAREKAVQLCALTPLHAHGAELNPGDLWWQGGRKKRAAQGK